MFARQQWRARLSRTRTTRRTLGEELFTPLPQHDAECSCRMAAGAKAPVACARLLLVAVDLAPIHSWSPSSCLPPPGPHGTPLPRSRRAFSFDTAVVITWKNPSLVQTGVLGGKTTSSFTHPTSWARVAAPKQGAPKEAPRRPACSSCPPSPYLAVARPLLSIFAFPPQGIPWPFPFPWLPILRSRQRFGAILLA